MLFTGEQKEVFFFRKDGEDLIFCEIEFDDTESKNTDLRREIVLDKTIAELWRKSRQRDTRLIDGKLLVI